MRKAREAAIADLAAIPGVPCPCGTRHRAVPGRGRMRILNSVVPPFDPKDEWYD
jgi:hypothetical protein